MKKKILICLGIFLTIALILLFCFIGSIKKTPLTPEKYISIMNSHNIQVQQEDINALDENSQKLFLKLLNAGEHAGFAKCSNIENARLVFDLNYVRVKNAYKQAGITTFYNSIDFSNNHYQYKSFSTSTDYYVLIQVEDTIVQFLVNKVDKDKVNSTIKDFGYDIGFDINIITIYTVISIIIGTLLILICFASIFEKHNIHPLFVFVPIANTYYICKIADKNGWKMFFFLIPFFNFFYYFILMYKLSKIYTNNKLACFLTGFLPLIFLPAIAFDEPIIKENKNIYEEILKEENVI